MLRQSASLSGAAYTMTWRELVDRRRGLRISMPFPTIVRGIDADSQAFEECASVHNLSAYGLYLRLSRYVERGRRRFAVVWLTTSSAGDGAAPCVAFYGLVMRVEPHTDGAYGLALSFTRRRFMYANVP